MELDMLSFTEPDLIPYDDYCDFVKDCPDKWIERMSIEPYIPIVTNLKWGGGNNYLDIFLLMKDCNEED